jgi:hypothetical protein
MQLEKQSMKFGPPEWGEAAKLHCELQAANGSFGQKRKNSG